MYKLLGTQLIKESDGVIAIIPADEANTDYTEYLAWETAGGVAEQIQEQKVYSITMRQAKRELEKRGLLTSIEATIATMPIQAIIDWEEANELCSNNPYFIQIANSLNYSEEAITDFFQVASTI